MTARQYLIDRVLREAVQLARLGRDCAWEPAMMEAQIDRFEQAVDAYAAEETEEAPA